MKKILKRYSVVSPAEIDELTSEAIDNLIQKIADNPKLSGKLYKQHERGINCTSYVIPVTDGNITGYLFSGASEIAITSSKPLIIYFHGGGWMMGNMERYKAYCSHLAALTNSQVLLLDYRLAPQYKFPTAVEDCFDAWLWALAGLRYWKADPDRIFFIGDSAGGAICCGVSQLCRDRKKPLPIGQILIYPITDGRLRTESFALYADSPTLTDKLMQFYISNYQREPKDILSPLFSPLLATDMSRLPDTLVISSELDPLRDDGRLYAGALNEGGSKANYFELKGALHGTCDVKGARGTANADCMIKQFVSGRPLEKIQNITEAELKKEGRLKMQAARLAPQEKDS